MIGLVRLCALASFALTMNGAIANAESVAPSADTFDSASPAQRIYATARPKLVQVRTLLTTTGQQVVIGSGFLVASPGNAITNYHVVSQAALEPDTYRLEFTSAEGSHGQAKILMLDLADDLAVISLEGHDDGHFVFDSRPLADLTKGERLYAMGNPLDLGFSIVEGTYNGLVEHSYVQRIHFSGALNPGMSGGPTVTADGRVVGINVAHQVGGELVSFLVPAQFAASLLAQADSTEPPTPESLRAEIGRQLTDWSTKLYDAVGAIRLKSAGFGPYLAPQIDSPWFTCWAETNAGRVPKPRASIEATHCTSDTRLFVSEDLNTGMISLTQSLVRSVDLNQFQFATFLARQVQLPWLGPAPRKWFTPQRCEEGFTKAPTSDAGPPIDAVWCARAYRQFDGLYDVAVMSVTQDSGSEALVSRLGIQGVTYENAMALTKRIFAALQWSK
jgi:S1-C subfamily serine protease